MVKAAGFSGQQKGSSVELSTVLSPSQTQPGPLLPFPVPFVIPGDTRGTHTGRATSYMQPYRAQLAQQPVCTAFNPSGALPAAAPSPPRPHSPLLYLHCFSASLKPSHKVRSLWVVAHSRNCFTS